MHDVIVIGAGAAGMMAAARAAEGGAATLVLEKNRKTGVKILMSGGTRCNLTHDCESAGIIEAFGKQGRFLRQALQHLGPRETVALFNSMDVATKVESTGKVFPASDRAVQVRDALRRLADRAGATFILDAGVRDVAVSTGGLTVHTQRETFEARRVIVTSGGRSWPGCGTTGDGYGWLSALGHTIVPTHPALVPLVGGSDWTRSLSGLTLDNVAVGVFADDRRSQPRGGKPIVQRRGGFLFTHWGFSGPAVMDVSGAIAAVKQPAAASMVCDWVPELSISELETWFDQKRSRAGAQRIGTALNELMPKRLAENLTIESGAAETPFGELAKGTRQRLIESIKWCALPISGTRGFEKAEVTAGGVDLKQVDPRTMQSRLIPNLYIAGEILDLDGWIGGYNFQSAFSTGSLAGTHAAQSLREHCA
jgi:predicted Rossmann fold flavoprotein